jgi:hypothetical protein
MKKFLGVYDIKKMTPEQIYEKMMKTLQEKEYGDLLEKLKRYNDKKK